MRPSIRPFGIGDLNIVKKKLVAYEPGEIAHIENVMAQETRDRTHRKLRQTEVFTLEEEEILEENEQDLEQTERFEIENETEETIKSDTKLQAGVDVSASYGPVKINAFGRASSTSSREESSRQSTAYAKEVTERARSRLERKARRQRTARELTEVEETNAHGFLPAPDHNVGVYRWVDKYYRAKVFNYGKRLMYEFVVPEPSAFYVFSKLRNQERELPEEPQPPEIDVSGTELTRPDLLTRENYLIPVGQLRVQGVKPPPAEAIHLVKQLPRELEPSQYFAFTENGFDIPEGYEAVNWGGAWSGVHQNGSLGVYLADDRVDPSTDTSLPGLRDSIPVGAQGDGYLRFFAHFILRCELTDEAFAKWQLETYAAIMSAYQKALLDYEDVVASAQVQGGVSIEGQSPAINRTIERQELKKLCVTLWVQDQLDYASRVIDENRFSNQYPEVLFGAALSFVETIEGKTAWSNEKVRFLEESFEWHNITYEFYPYYWARKRKWLDKLALESTDPLFEAFLRAGAAVVRVPVKPSCAAAVLFYQLTGRVWEGSEPPELTGSSPDLEIYISYLEELEGEEDLAVRDVHEDVDIPDDDPDSWPMKVPTNLVWLQNDSPDSQLPSLETS